MDLVAGGFVINKATPSSFTRNKERQKAPTLSFCFLINIILSLLCQTHVLRIFLKLKTEIQIKFVKNGLCNMLLDLCKNAFKIALENPYIFLLKEPKS